MRVHSGSLGIAVAAAVVLFAHAAASAGGWAMQGGFIYGTRSLDIYDTNTSEIVQSLNLGFGYYNQDIFVGGRYFDWTAKEKNSTAAGATTTIDTDINGVGASVGYLQSAGGLQALVSYLHNPTKEISISSQKYDGGYGIMVDVGYGVKIKSIMIGPDIVWVKNTYRNLMTTQGESKVGHPWEDTLVIPFFGIWATF